MLNNFPKIKKALKNKYIITLLLFLLWILFFDNYSYIEHRILDKKINQLEENINYYKNETKKDSTKIKELNNNDNVEKYAREQYYMKRKNEDIYIIENEK